MRLPTPEDVQAQFGVSRETMRDLEKYVGLVLKWTKKINLISKTSQQDIWSRHIADSLQCVPLVDHDKRGWVDIGSGGGFPGIVCAIWMRELAPYCRFTLVDSDQRKCLFLKTVARELSLDIDVISGRIQNLVLPHTDILTARALAPLGNLLELAEPIVSSNTVCLFPKGEDVDCELTAARENWKMSVTKYPSLTNSQAVILKIGDLARV